MTERLRPDRAESAEKFLVCDCEDIPEFGGPPSPVRVIASGYYKEKLKRERQDQPAFSMSTPKVHEDYDGNIIHDDNFPNCDLVCPNCGKRYETETIVERDLDEKDRWDLDENVDNEANSSESRVVQSYTVVNELDDITDMWRVLKNGEKQIDVKENKKEAKEVVQDQYPIQMDLEWTEKNNGDKLTCSVEKGDYTTDRTYYTIEYTY